MDNGGIFMFKNKSEKLLAVYFIKVVISSVCSVLMLTYCFSLIILKLDLGVDKAGFVSIIVYSISAAITSIISVTGLKNNGLLMGIISQLPLILLSLFNLIFCSNTLLLFIVKVIISLTVGSVCGFLTVKRGKRFKIK